jgi:signal transduction histidine kinase
MSAGTLRDLLVSRRDYIVEAMRSRLNDLPRSSWADFVLRTKEGQRRLNIWIDLVIKALEGDPQVFVQDQERVGYSRAVQEVEFKHGYDLYSIFQTVIADLLSELTLDKNPGSADLCRDVHVLSQVLLRAYSVNANSYLKIRQEQINEKVTNLEELYQFTHKILTTTALDELVHVVLPVTAKVFGVEETCLAICRDGQGHGFYSYRHQKVCTKIRRVVEAALKAGVTLFVDEAGEIYTDIDLSKLKRIVALPVKANATCFGILVLHNSSQGFRFTRRELTLLNHFVYVMASGLARVLMLEEIEQSRERLRLLAAKMITIQEEERRRLAEDIHDTLAQALTGICYQVQFCKELAKRDRDLLSNRLDALVTTINHTIDQSRQLISSLHPDLIDTVGLVPALRRFFDNYNSETGVRVLGQLPKSVQTSRDVSICLFRVIQEALTNVYKHADIRSVRVRLKETKDRIILTVTDKGRGFEMSPGCRAPEGQDRLGLLSMKERIEGVSGTFSISAASGKGCRIEATIPLISEVRIDDQRPD